MMTVWMNKAGHLFLFVDLGKGRYLIQENEDHGILYEKESWQDVLLMLSFWRTYGFEELGEL